MDLGIVGLGKMGANMAVRLVGGGCHVVGYDQDSAVVARVASSGAQGADSLAALAGKLPTSPRHLDDDSCRCASR